MTVLYLVYSSEGVGVSPIMIIKATITVATRRNALGSISSWSKMLMLRLT